MAKNEKLIVLIGTPAASIVNVDGGNAAGEYVISQVIDGGGA